MFGQVRLDRFLQRLDCFERPTPDPLLGDRSEESFDLVDPGGTRRREVDNEPRVFRQPSFHRGSLVSRIVVHHQVNGHAVLDRDRFIDLGQELQELLVPMTAIAFADDFPGCNIQGGKERGDAVANVVVGSSFGLARGHGQYRLGSVEGLDLGFLIDTQNNRSIRRVQVQADDVADFLDEVGIGREFERLVEVGLEPEGAPDSTDGGLRQARGLSHPTCTPVRGVFGFALQSFRHNLLDPGVRDGSRSTGTGFVGQSVESVIEEPLPPLTNGWECDAKVGRDNCVGVSFGRGQDDLGTQGEPLSGGRAAAPRNEFRPFIRCQRDWLQGSSEWHSYLLEEP